MSPPIQWEVIRIINYLTLLRWKRQLRAILLIEGAWCIICGDLKKPGDSKTTEAKERETWTRLENVALGWMFLTLEDYTRQSVVKFIDPMDVLENLYTRYTPPCTTFNLFTEKERYEIPPVWPNRSVVYQESDAVNDEARAQGRITVGARQSPRRGLFQDGDSKSKPTK